MTKPAFRPIASPLHDVPDDALDQLVDRLGVPRLERPEPPPAPAHATLHTTPVATSAGGAPEESETAQPSPLPGSEPVPAPLEKMSVDLPTYLTRAMRMRAAEERKTIRYFTMLGLQAIGFHIEPCDLVSDGRGGRSKKG